MVRKPDRGNRLARSAPHAGGRRGKERAARHERSGDWRRGAAGSPDPDAHQSEPYLLLCGGPLAPPTRMTPRPEPYDVLADPDYVTTYWRRGSGVGRLEACVGRGRVSGRPKGARSRGG